MTPIAIIAVILVLAGTILGVTFTIINARRGSKPYGKTTNKIAIVFLVLFAVFVVVTGIGYIASR